MQTNRRRQSSAPPACNGSSGFFIGPLTYVTSLAIVQDYPEGLFGEVFHA